MPSDTLPPILKPKIKFVFYPSEGEWKHEELETWFPDAEVIAFSLPATGRGAM